MQVLKLKEGVDFDELEKWGFKKNGDFYQKKIKTRIGLYLIEFYIKTRELVEPELFGQIPEVMIELAILINAGIFEIVKDIPIIKTKGEDDV